MPQPDFTYRSSLTRYVEVYADGSLGEGVSQAAYERAKWGESRLFIQQSDRPASLYPVEHLDMMAVALGFLTPDDTGLQFHSHQFRWSLSDLPGSRRAAFVEFRFLCGCRASPRYRHALARHLQRQLGWEILTNNLRVVPMPDGPDVHIFRVYRRTLKNASPR